MGKQGAVILFVPLKEFCVRFEELLEDVEKRKISVVILDENGDELAAMIPIEKQDILPQIEKLVAGPHEIRVDSDSGGGFIASIPSLPGCLSCDETRDEAMEK